MGRNDALRLVRLHISKNNNLKHMIAVGAVMKEVAARLGEDAHKWEVVGILHDIVFELCSRPSDHTIKAKDKLKGKVDNESIEAIMAHNYEHKNVPVDMKFKKALVACDAITGLVIACALVMPSKKLADVKPESLKKMFDSKDFARNVNRERIAVCNDTGIALGSSLPCPSEAFGRFRASLDY